MDRVTTHHFKLVGHIPDVVLLGAFAAYMRAVFSGASVVMSWYAIFLVSVATLLILGLHVWVPSLDPINEMVSQYSDVHRYGILMRTAFFCLGLAVMSLAYSTKHFLLMGWGFIIATFVAGIFVIMMGVFSMRTLAPHEIHTSPFEGTAHGISTGISFSLAIVTMLVFACYPSVRFMNAYAWVRGVALIQFNIALLAVVIYGILSVRKVRVTPKRGGQDGLLRGVLKDARQTSSSKLPDGISTNGDLPQSPRHQDSGAAGGDLQTTMRWLGLAERILIFLFLEWVFTLAILVRGWG